MDRRIPRWRRLLRAVLGLALLSLVLSYALYNVVLTVHVLDVVWVPTDPAGCQGIGLGPNEVLTPGGVFRFGSTVVERLAIENSGAEPCEVTNVTLLVGTAWPVHGGDAPLRVAPGSTSELWLVVELPSHAFDQSVVVNYEVLPMGPSAAGA